MALIPIPLTSGSGSYTPQTIEARRKLAQQLISGQVKDQGWGGALANTLTGARAGYEGDQAAQQEAEGTDRSSRLFAQALSSDNPSIQTLGTAASDPFLNQNQASIINALIGQNDPDRLLARKQAQLNYDQDLSGTGVDANLPSNIQEWNAYNKLSPEDQSRYLTMKRANPALNVGTGFVTPDQANPGSTLGAAIPIDNMGKAQDTAIGTGMGEQSLTTIDAGRNAANNNAKLDVLEQTLANAPQGAVGGLTQLAGGFGIDIGGLSDVQAAQAIISSMVPLQRAPGSGTMSDADLDLFKRSLPSIINQPDGNKKIIQTLRAINNYTIAHAQIEQRLATHQITQAQAVAEKQAIPNPLAGISGGAPTPAPTGGNVYTDQHTGVTIRQIGQ